MHIRFELDSCDWQVVREFWIPASYSIYELHLCLQVGMGWNDEEAFEFMRKGLTVGTESSFSGAGIIHDGHAYRHADETTLADLVLRVGQKVSYTYDFARLWQGKLTLLAQLESDEELPSCARAEGLAPPELLESCYGLEVLLIAVNDPAHDFYTLALATLGEDYRAEVPSPEEYTDTLQDLFAEDVEPFGKTHEDEDEEWAWWDPSKYDEKMRLAVLKEDIDNQLFGQINGKTATERQTSLLEALKGNRG